MKFDGFVVSDWEDVIKLHTRNKITETPEEAVRISGIFFNQILNHIK